MVIAQDISDVVVLDEIVMERGKINAGDQGKKQDGKERDLSEPRPPGGW